MKETAYDPAGDNAQSPAPGMAATDTHNPATPVQPGSERAGLGAAAPKEEKPSPDNPQGDGGQGLSSQP